MINIWIWGFVTGVIVEEIITLLLISILIAKGKL